MRLNNKELKVVVEEIYKRVSLPIIEANKKVTDKITIEDEYTRDCELFDKLDKELNEIQSQRNSLASKWRDTRIGDTTLGYNPMIKSVRQFYVDAKKAQVDGLIKYPTKEEIESQIIIAGYSEIPELIAQITAMYQ